MSHLFSLLSVEVSGLASETVLQGTESKSQILATKVIAVLTRQGHHRRQMWRT